MAAGRRDEPLGPPLLTQGPSRMVSRAVFCLVQCVSWPSVLRKCEVWCPFPDLSSMRGLRRVDSSLQACGPSLYPATWHSGQQRFPPCGCQACSDCGMLADRR